jgi:hypothetical protein
LRGCIRGVPGYLCPRVFHGTPAADGWDAQGLPWDFDMEASEFIDRNISLDVHMLSIPEDAEGFSVILSSRPILLCSSCLTSPCTCGGYEADASLVVAANQMSAQCSALPTVTPPSLSENSPHGDKSLSKALQTRDGLAAAQSTTLVVAANQMPAQCSALPTVTPPSLSENSPHGDKSLSKALQTRDGLAAAQSTTLVDAGCQCSTADWNSLYIVRDDDWSVDRGLGAICPPLPIWPTDVENLHTSDSDDDLPSSPPTRPFFSKAVLSAYACGKFSFGVSSRTHRSVGVHVCPADWPTDVSPLPCMGVIKRENRLYVGQGYSLGEEYSYDPYDKE